MTSCPAPPSRELVARFGPSSRAARACLRAFYDAAPSDGQAGAAAPRVTAADARGREALGPLARAAGLDPAALDPARLLLSVHTYLALLIKLVAWLALSRPAPGGAAAFAALGRLPPPHLLRRLGDMESGAVFRDLGVDNLLEGDGLGWYAGAATRGVADAAAGLTQEVAALGLGRPAALFSRPPRDVFKALCHRLLPRGLRHDLGEYYTPDWLARRLLQALCGRPAPAGGAPPGAPQARAAGTSGALPGRLLDPACGSGTFLVLAVWAAAGRCRRLGLDGAQTLGLVLESVVGLDNSPLAVLAARCNYILALGGLWRHRGAGLRLPVHLADSILGPPPAPLVGQFDWVAGNPPWVGWESLSPALRSQSRPLWARQGLWPHEGMEAILGQGKKDLCALATYQALEAFLRPGGRLGFVVPRSLLKSAGAGQGFRRFCLGDGTPVAPVLVEDLGELRVFEGAASRPVVLIMEKGRAAGYPVPYVYWQRLPPGGREGGSVHPASSLGRVLAATRRVRMSAAPVDPGDAASPWVTAPPRVLRVLRRVLGPSDYRARAGVYSGGANGVYWLEVLEWRPGGLALARNLAAGQRRAVDRVTAELEAELLYPLLRGRDLGRWRAEPSAWVLVVQDPATRRGLPPDQLRAAYPRAYEYLCRFESVLRARRSQAVRRLMESGAFYSMFGVGEYTLAPHKVAWAQMGRSLRACAVSARDGRPVLPEHVHAFVAVASREEALYAAAVLNSTPFDAAVAACSEVGGKGFAAPHVLQHVRLPAYRAGDPRHRQLAALSEEAHRARARGDAGAVAGAEAAIDALAGPLWGLAEPDLLELRGCLAGLRGRSRA